MHAWGGVTLGVYVRFQVFHLPELQRKLELQLIEWVGSERLVRLTRTRRACRRAIRLSDLP